MAEELTSQGFTKNGIFIGNYEYYPVQRSNLNQLKKYKIIPNKDYGVYSLRQPDGLLVDRTNKNDIRIIAVIEYKYQGDFRTDKQKVNAIEQCNDLCQVLNASFGVITDNDSYIWINPKNSTEDNKYLDRTSGTVRSYSLIKNEDKKYLTEPFLLQKNSQKDYDKIDLITKNTLFYVERVLTSINEKNSQLTTNEKVDPINLATSVWQDIYVNTGKSPTKCLYNVVEIFIFKFLSDLGVLKHPNNFEFVYQLSLFDAQEAIKYYARNCRAIIKYELFRAGEDGTTILNGTIFVDTKGEAVIAQSTLFKNSLKKYNEFGSLKYIQRNFKTKLFETFLKQSSDKSRLGQFFTPRKVVKAIVEMADVEKLHDGARVCDPFCGVGGFITETMQKPTRLKDFFPNTDGEIRPKVTYLGFDKGNDDDDERVIILAKANMLIYLSDIIEKHPNLATQFSQAINNTFHFISDSNLGTLSRKFEDEKQFDLILTNPPYITSGVNSLRDEIVNAGIADRFTTNAKGVDGLCTEWIIRNLKKGGRAFVVLPSGLFTATQNAQLKTFIKKNCFINAIISLPIKTFFNTPQKTFILIITKKNDIKEEQKFPVFTYLVNDIGETLNIYRFENEGESDLEKAKNLFNYYKGNPETFNPQIFEDKRCKVQPFEKFDAKENWVIDRWWSKEEKIELGIEQQEPVITIGEFKEKLSELLDKLTDFRKDIELLNDEIQKG